MLYDEGGEGPPILLLHGLMGRGSTWGRVVPWLRRYGRVHTFDARFHRGRDTDPEAGDISTEALVEDAAQALAALGPESIVVGHSMGGLHALCLAARYPDVVRAIVVEDMAVDFKGGTSAPWDDWFDSWPVEFDSAAGVTRMFGDVAGRYFLEAFDRTATGHRLHGRIRTWRAIANHWGTRDYWDEWRAVKAPALLVEGEHTITPPGQMRRMAELHPHAAHLVVEGAAHLVHDEAPETYRGAVEAFLAGL